MKTYLLLFVTALVSALVFTPLVRTLCVRRGWFDVPRDARRVHQQAIPRLGGVAVFLATLVALSSLLLFDNQVTQTFEADGTRFLRALLPATLIFVLGVYDDLHGVNPRVKFAAQALAAALLYALGGRIEGVSAPFVGSLEFPAPVGFLLTVFWIVVITNAFNLIDGIDGLAAGAALFAAVVMIVVSIALGHPFVTIVALALAGALTGFLRYNFNPASIFLGDSGSLTIGFLLAALSLQGPQKAATTVAVAIPLMAFGLPIMDTLLALLRRFIGRRPLFEGDREHIHHMLLARGWSQRQAVFVLYGVCALFALQAMLFASDAGVGRITGLGLFVVGVIVLLAVEQLHYHEVDELRARVKRQLSLTERRQRLASNIRVRRAGQALARATTLSATFEAVEQLLRESEFVSATVVLGNGHAGNSARALERECDAPVLQRASLRDGNVCWTWERQAAPHATAELNGLWSLHLPLTAEGVGSSGSAEDATWGYINLYRLDDDRAVLPDLNCLAAFFQRQLARAAERVLTSAVQEERAGKAQPRTKELVTDAAVATFTNVRGY